MSKIIALQGKGNKEKSNTIYLLRDILLLNGYSLLRGSRRGRGFDFTEVFVKDQTRIGVTSLGDIGPLLTDRLNYLIHLRCDICICTCRTYDRGNYRGTIAAVEGFGPGIHYVTKSIACDESQLTAVNMKDAELLFKEINRILDSV